MLLGACDVERRLPSERSKNFRSRPRRDPERIDFGRIQTGSNLDQTVPRLPTHQELALRPLYVIAGSAGLVIGWIELY